MSENNYKINLDNIFEGPMDLLIYLIKKNEVDIYDIPIALITNQYLSYLELMKSMNIDLAGDFIFMAATLTQIKSKMLLPAHEDNVSEEDPRTEIIEPLMQYLQMKSAAEHLATRDILGENTFVRSTDKEDYPVSHDEEIVNVGLFELIDAFQKILKNISADVRLEFTANRISVKDRIAELVEIFEKKESITFNELFSSDTGKSDIILTFLAILEMVKLRLIRIVQHVQTGIIRLFYD
ncbi:MAG: segregation/condensation protein A [Deltaproteobacteria bacterium]|nr:segregation/condensation protein A [Deltaproteobacteria bacterium]MBW2661325.1 segregation/condensation protein A [Deltaproteobacteria bacterium]